MTLTALGEEYLDTRGGGCCRRKYPANSTCDPIAISFLSAFYIRAASGNRLLRSMLTCRSISNLQYFAEECRSSTAATSQQYFLRPCRRLCAVDQRVDESRTEDGLHREVFTEASLRSDPMP